MEADSRCTHETPLHAAVGVESALSGRPSVRGFERYRLLTSTIGHSLADYRAAARIIVTGCSSRHRSHSLWLRPSRHH
jgi:hypothetical protein